MCIRDRHCIFVILESRSWFNCRTYNRFRCIHDSACLAFVLRQVLDEVERSSTSERILRKIRSYVPLLCHASCVFDCWYKNIIDVARNSPRKTFVTVVNSCALVVVVVAAMLGGISLFCGRGWWFFFHDRDRSCVITAISKGVPHFLARSKLGTRTICSSLIHHLFII